MASEPDLGVPREVEEEVGPDRDDEVEGDAEPRGVVIGVGVLENVSGVATGERCVCPRDAGVGVGVVVWLVGVGGMMVLVIDGGWVMDGLFGGGAESELDIDVGAGTGGGVVVLGGNVLVVGEEGEVREGSRSRSRSRAWQK